jgi:nucleoside-diphosphate-sugar epimerase
MKSKKIILTGSAGFIGGRLLELLSKKYPKNEFIGIDRKYDMEIHNGNVKLFGIDINDGLPSVSDVDVVVHLAALPSVRDSDKQVKNVINDNILATQNIIDKCVNEWKPRRILITSSSSVYDGRENKVTNEDDALRPLSPYAVSKLVNEMTVQMYKDNGKLKDIETAVIRPFTVYGPNQRDKLCIQAIIDAFIHDTVFTLYGDGHVRRDFTYIDDTCAAIEKLMYCNKLSYPIYNIGTGTNISINEVISGIGLMFNKPLKIKYEPPTIYDTDYTKAGIARIKEDTGWEPKMGLYNGLVNQISWQKQH